MIPQELWKQILEILKESECVCYEKSWDSYSAVLCWSPACKPMIQRLLGMKQNAEI